MVCDMSGNHEHYKMSNMSISKECNAEMFRPHVSCTAQNSFPSPQTLSFSLNHNNSHGVPMHCDASWSNSLDGPFSYDMYKRCNLRCCTLSKNAACSPCSLLHHENSVPEMDPNSLQPICCCKHGRTQNHVDSYANNPVDLSLRPFPIAKQLSSQTSFQSPHFWNRMETLANDCSQKQICFCNTCCNAPCCFKSPSLQCNNVHKPIDFYSPEQRTTLWEPVVDYAHSHYVSCDNSKKVSTQCPMVYEAPGCFHSSCYEKNICHHSQAYANATYCCQLSSKNHDSTPILCCHGMHGAKESVHKTVRSNTSNPISYPFKPCEKTSLSHDSSTQTASSRHSLFTSFSSTPREHLGLKTTAFQELSQSNKESRISQTKNTMLRFIESKNQSNSMPYKKKMTNDKKDAKKTFLVKEKLTCPARKINEKNKWQLPHQVQNLYYEGEPPELKEEYATDPDILPLASKKNLCKETCSSIENTTKHDQGKPQQAFLKKTSFGTALGRNRSFWIGKQQRKTKNILSHTLLPSTNEGNVRDEACETFSKPWEETLRCPGNSLLSYDKEKTYRSIKHNQSTKQLNSQGNIQANKSLPVNVMKLFDTDILPCQRATSRSLSCSHEPFTTKKVDVKHLPHSTDGIEVTSTLKKIETKDQDVQTDSVEDEVNTPTFQSKVDEDIVKTLLNEENSFKEEKKKLLQNSLQKTPCTETCHLQASKTIETFHVEENNELWKTSAQQNSRENSSLALNSNDSTKTCWKKLHSLLYTSPKKHGNLQPIQRNVTDHFRMRRLPKPLYTKNYEIIPIGPLTESVAKNTALSTKCSLPLPYAVYL
ncbi:uncharacterized protein LOC128882975 [Hylaeus volcanicus]|uniref:uncharacterized protein LOC128882975 n=1 Tax=Hylaeus volcanicus TaxID=313075 RepID=UPI0023B7E430|nr:uncharacterized protein LOC128882975 [Hylaeus volcanicus]